MILSRLSAAALIGGVLATTGIGAADAAILLGSATLSGSQEVPANTSTASGTGTFTYDTATNTLSDVLIEVDGILTTDLVTSYAHIHEAPAGSNGPIIVHLWDIGTLTATATGFTLFVASTTVTDAQEASLLAGNTYFNIHTLTFRGGEIRGQIAVTPIPAALPLLATALGGIGLVAWRRRR
jgi:hypothetical protein